MGIKLKSKGQWKKTKNWLVKNKKINIIDILNRYGKIGVQALQNATPINTGKTAMSWDYEIINEDNKSSIIWTNSNVVEYVNVAVILQYGHGTKSGGYVDGIDYINPALKPIFDNIANAAWKEVTT